VRAFRCHCACRDLCRHEHCQVRPFVALFALMSDGDLTSSDWWYAVRRARDGVLAVLRAGPDHSLNEGDARFWAEYLAAVERLSAKLDRDYAVFRSQRHHGQRRGTA
jgi:hypothetical protein